MSAHGKTRLLSLTWGVYVLPFSPHCLSFQGICVISLPFKINEPYYSNIRSLGKNSENPLSFLCSSLTIILRVYCWSLIFFLEYKLVLATVFAISGNSTGLAIIWVCVWLYFQLSDQARAPAHKGRESVWGMFTPLKEMGDQAENPVLRDLKRTGQV